MDLQTAKKRAIQLINEYSNNGALIASTKNADYTLRMNNLADYVQNEISDRVGVDATYTIDDTTTIAATENGYKKYNLPTDFKEHRYVLLDDKRFDIYRIESNQIWIPEQYTGTFKLNYYKFPTTIDDDTADAYVFEVDAYTHQIIPYYLGGMVIADENSEISNKLLNIYYERLAGLYKRNLQMTISIRNVMGGWC